ncbi:RHS repeat-associated core domain-containing protein [Brevundimonas sp. MF30-B]|nr:RHS repeat-associated core domain-containing protein [Brevundimonas sp. MF30-B]
MITSYEGATFDRRWLLADERGSILTLSNNAGAVTALNTYDEYGVPGPNNAGTFQYRGQVWLPQAQAYHYRARAYAPQLGRFLQTDPIGYAAGANLYAYVGADQVNRIDPLGLQRKYYVTCSSSVSDFKDNESEVVLSCQKKLVV